MCFFDSPVSRCEMMHEMVLTDQTQAECAREHGCPAGRDCPLCAYFTETSGVAEGELPAAKAPSPELFEHWPLAATAPPGKAPLWMARKDRREQRLSP